MEIWKDIEGYEGSYQVSNLGKVRSLPRKDNLNRLWKGKVLKAFSDNNKGYMCVQLKSKQFKVHILVAKAFIPNPLNKPQVNHRDGNKENNLESNLEWVTQEENIQHSFKIGLISRKGEKNSQSKLTKEDVSFIRENFKRGDSSFGVKAMAGKFNVSTSQVNRIVRGSHWKDIE